MAKPNKSQPVAAAPEKRAETVAPPFAHGLLALIVFLSGAAIMIIEISAYRLLAPLFGNSAYTWTALIGVVLIAFSAGGYLGGWLSEKRSDFTLLGWLLAGSSVLTLFVPALHVIIAPSFERAGLISGPLVMSVLLFLLPGILLGAVSPASLRLYSLLGKDAHVGVAAGTVSMLGSLGSFAGTLVTGFYLVSTFGVKSIFMGTGVVLLVLASVAFFMARNTPMQQLPVWLAGLVAALVGATATEAKVANVIHEENSYYHRLQVIEQGQGIHAQRYLHLDSTLEGGMRVSDGALVLEYQRYWQLVTMKPGFQVKRALFIGAGAFGMPEQLSKQFPDAVVDVCEIDPRVIEAGRKFFKLDEFPKVQAHAGDARRFLVQNPEAKYDFIFGDAYNGIRQIPVHLASKEFFQLIRDRLTPQGIFLMNAISAVEGPRSELLAGMLQTVGEVFPKVELFAVGGRLTEPQNAMILAGSDDWSTLFTDQTYVSGTDAWRIANSYVPLARRPLGGVVFTDNLNPVDAIIARGLMMD